ncbi:Phage integrase family protein [Pseudovibrio sp. Ad13]|nr:tyrosine-type recombinase/integrase [Pseudovibrio sp. Ad13]KZK86117.1 Phage integrase family protein [Pseudovibrio sp. Ad13]
MLSQSYGCSMRTGEVIQLTTGDIDSTHSIIYIAQAKKGKDRYIMFSTNLLELLRELWREHPTGQEKMCPRPSGFFPRNIAATSIGTAFFVAVPCVI